MPDEGIGCGFTEAVRGVLSHHMVIRGGKIANYHPYPPTPWNGNPRDVYGTPGPYEDAVQNTPIFEENPPDKFKGIDIMRAVRSFDPCLPCGVHMFLGKGRVLERMHSPSMLNIRARTGGREARAACGAAPVAGRRRRSGETAVSASSGCSRRSARWRARPCWQRVEELMRVVVELYGAGLGRIVAHRRRRRRTAAGESRAG